MLPGEWIKGNVARDLRKETLSVARHHRDEYRAHGMGFHRRLLRMALDLARDYRRREHEPEHRQEAA